LCVGSALVLELCTGDLNKFITEGLPYIDKSCIEPKLLLGQIAIGISYLHSRGIVHRDLKPNNILLQRMTERLVVVKLADFGLSKQGQEQANFTDPIGTSGYMAPEILREKNCSDPKIKPMNASDIWAFGIIVYYVLSGGEHPFGNVFHSDFRDHFVIKVLKKARAIQHIVNDWAATDLIIRLLRYEPERRPIASVLIYHPFFSMGHSTAEILYKKFFAKLWEISARDTELQRNQHNFVPVQLSKTIEWANSYDNIMSTQESDLKLVTKH
jgi:serine/threonine-protein kinase/endoribonuclease IRE1